MNFINKIKRKSKSDIIFDIVVNLALFLVVIVVIYPLYFVVIASISDPDLVNAGKVMLIPKGITNIGYKMVFQNKNIWIGYYNTIRYTIGYTLISSVVTLSAGYALSRKNLFGKKLINMLFIFTMYFNSGLIPVYLVMKKLSLINNPFIIILMHAVIMFYLIMARTYFETTIPEALEDAGKIDGCNTFSFFIRIVLPVSKAIVAVIVLYYVVAQWNSYFTALIYLNNPDDYPLQIILRQILVQSQQMSTDISGVSGEYEKVAGVVKFGVIVVSAVPMLVLYPFLQKYFVEGIMVGSVKG